MTSVAIPSTGYCLAFDFGTARIGVAQGDCSLGIATPLTTISSNSKDQIFTQIGALIQEWQPQWLIVGLPLHLDGNHNETTQAARTFGHRLNGRFGLPVYYVDERLSSMLAEELLKQVGVKGRKQKPMLDQVAAQAILQSFFDGSAESVFTGRSELSGSLKA